MILQLIKFLYAHAVIDDLPLSVCGGCKFWKEISPKSKIWYPVKLVETWIPQLQLVKNWKQNYCDTLFAIHEIAY